MYKRFGYILLFIMLLEAIIIWLSPSCITQTPQVTIKNQSFYIDTVDKPSTREKGLSNQLSLDREHGMLFVFPKADYYQFVMRNMNFPLDIIFIKENKIVDIKKNLPPEGATPKTFYTPISDADKVLEINSGLSNKYNFQVGDQVFFSPKNDKNYCLLFQNVLKFK